MKPNKIKFSPRLLKANLYFEVFQLLDRHFFVIILFILQQRVKKTLTYANEHYFAS